MVKLISFQDESTSNCAVVLQSRESQVDVLDLKSHAQALVANGASAKAVAAMVDAGDLSGLIANAQGLMRPLHALLAKRSECEVRTISANVLLAPIPKPARNVFCVGRNYLKHILEGDAARGIKTPVPQSPQFFTKPPSAVIGHEGFIEVEPWVSDKIDYEVELGVVIGKAIRNATLESAMDAVFGYTIINDVTARDLQRKHEQWFKGKGLDTFCPVGPYIVTADEFGDPYDARIELSVNGQLRQSDNTGHMHFHLDRIIAELSQGMTLLPGDLIATGTPSGVGYGMDPPQFLRPGDVVECHISRLGVLRSHVKLRDRSI
jgi:2-keto-4-pentenoate hydratase/2-oxohepta-3-ene-1,7-dioic acid hydratase in catechol pathway